MSKTIKQSLVILIVLLVISVAVAGLTLFQKQAVEKQNEYLQGQVTEIQSKNDVLNKQVKDLENKAQKLTKDLDDSNGEKRMVQRKLEDALREKQGLGDQIENFKRAVAEAENKVQSLRRERDDVMNQMKNRPVEEKIVEKIVYRDKAEDPSAPKPEPVEPVLDAAADGQQGGASFVIENKANEAYWAGVMRQKAALDIEIEKAKKEVSDAKMKVEELTKANSDLEIEVGRLKNEKEEIIRKIKYGEDLADNLSVELARARNEQKMIQDRADKVGRENQTLRTEIKQLTTTKIALEKSVSRLTDEKGAVEKKLVETENIIQGRIDEIWKVKKDIDTRFDPRAAKGSSEVELAPIVVNASGVAPKAAAAPVAAVKKIGAVVSVNEDNNFVIISLGEKAGVKVGDQFKVYRGGTSIGTVAVIQVRQDISAADIRQKNAAFKPGDTVK